MKVGIYESNIWTVPQYNEIYKQILDFNNICWESLTLDISEFWEKVSTLDCFIFRFIQVDEHLQIAKTILPIIENTLKIKVFPNQNTCWHYDDKVKQYYLAKINQIPFVDSYIFWNKDKALKWATNAEYPIVFKLKGGAASQNVILINNKSQAIRIINKIFGKGIQNNKMPSLSATKYLKIESFIKTLMYPLYAKIRGLDSYLFWNRHKNYALFQKYLPSNSFDTRITVIGNVAYSFRRFTRKNDFRASGSGLIDYDQGKIDKRCLRIAFDTSAKMGFQSMAYDFLFNENNKPEICEMSYTYQDKALFDCPGIWDNSLNWIHGHFWPGFLHLKELLGIKNLQQPKEILFQ